MAKFKLKFKLTGLEVELEGDRQDAPQITAALSNQLGGLLAPAASAMLEEPEPHKVVDVVMEEGGGAAKKRKTARRASKTTVTEASEAIDYRHDAEEWGIPNQSWSASKKALWLLYVVSKKVGSKELSAGVIAATFNRHFRQAGEIRASNVSRDFGNLKTKKKPAQVGEDAAAIPSKWYLTSEGEKEAEKFVSEAKGGEAAV